MKVDNFSAQYLLSVIAGVISIHFFVVAAGDLFPVRNSGCLYRRVLVIMGCPPPYQAFT